MLLYAIRFYSLLMLQDCFKMLVFVRLGFPPSILAFCSSVHIYSLPLPFDTNAYMLSILGVCLASTI